ncbi:MAG: hypothetical protein K9H84_02025 [Bacteroidales bacterium]|nr:hypothetical protein [Bacteroidales bacterium]
MDIKVQYIGKLFTLLAGLIILAHAAVPHHHHFGLTHSSEHETTCETPIQDKTPKDHDSHCRAFNILISERTNNSSFNKSISENVIFYIARITNNIEIPPIKELITSIFDYRAIFLKQFLSIAHSLRAPPAIY